MQAELGIANIQAVIEARQKQLETRRLFSALDHSRNVNDLRAIAKQATFYVFGFQDMLRLTEERIADSHIRGIAHGLRLGDKGHEKWFAFDLEQLGCAVDVPWTFGADHSVTRDVTYELISLLLRAEDDRVRLMLPLVLEATASVFFPRVVSMLKRAGFDKPLRFFSPSHLEAEADHDIYSEHGQAELAGIILDEASFSAAIKLIHAGFDCFERWSDYLETCRLARRWTW